MLKLKCYLKRQGVSQAVDGLHRERPSDMDAHGKKKHCRLTSDNCVITNKWPTFSKRSAVNLNVPRRSLARCRITACERCRTSMKEIPTLQTSA